MNDHASIPSPGRITIERHGDVRIVSFHGEHDVSTAALARERLGDARVRAGVTIVDLTATSFIDSSVVSALFDAYNADASPRLRFVVVPGTPPQRLFTLIGLDRIVPTYERLEDAFFHPGPAGNVGRRELCIFPGCGQTVVDRAQAAAMSNLRPCKL